MMRRMGIANRADSRIQLTVFALVSAAFTSVYVTQPILPVLQVEFGITPASASTTISAVIAGIAIASLPSGALADRMPVHRLIALGGIMSAACCFFIAATTQFPLIVLARFVQGLFLPALTTCVAAYLARNLDARRLQVAMGAYVSATVAGGLGGRLLGGWIHPPLHWRYAFVTTGALVLGATFAALRSLPPDERTPGVARRQERYLELLQDAKLLPIFLTACGAFCAFSSVFSFFPFRLAAPPLSASTSVITAMYLTYVVGIFIGPLAGRISARLGSGITLMIASTLFAVALTGTLVSHIGVLVVCLVFVCAGFFAIHAAAVGALNAAVTASRGRANALYMLFYYLGGAVGVLASGGVYTRSGWPGVVMLNIVALVAPFSAGVLARRRENAVDASGV
ncbi:MAG: MFS transporter [Pseudomonadota bacterium]|nr:MFS transporter [Pseudomonadota bacterium]